MSPEAWLLWGCRGVQAVLGAEEQCTLPYLFPLSVNPLLFTLDPATLETRKDISILS